MANIRDVANKAGTSISTVSRVLSNDETFKVSEQTKENIFNAVKTLDYHFTKKTRESKKFNIGCILAMTSAKYSDPFFTSIFSAIEKEAKNSHCHVSFIINYDELEDPIKLEKLCSMHLDGIILMETLPERIMTCLRSNIPNILAIDNYQSLFNCVGFDHFESTKQMMKHLISKDYRRIAYIGGGAPNIDMFNTKRLIMYRETLRKAAIEYDDTLVKDCYWDLDKCAQMTQELLQMPNRPDAIFAGSDSLAQVVLGQLYQSKLRCPEDIAVVGFNNLNFSSYLVPPLTTIDVPSQDIGIIAIKRLVDMIKNKDEKIYSILLPTKLIERNSTRGD